MSSDADRAVLAFEAWHNRLGSSQTRHVALGNLNKPFKEPVHVPVEEAVERFLKANPGYKDNKAQLIKHAYNRHKGILRLDKEKWELGSLDGIFE